MHEFAAPGSAPAISEGTGCGKEFFCVSPGEHLPCVPSHCLRSTGFIPLLSLANHAQKHTRKACTICSSSVYCREHLVLQTRLCLQHLLCPEQQPFPPGMTSCLIQMEQVHPEQHPASSQSCSLSGEGGRVFSYPFTFQALFFPL